MTTLSISPPFPLITDIDGQPLEDGYIWIGVANLPPIGNPIAVYWDAALTIPAALPIRTRGGYPVNAGTPARLYVGSDYSILVQNKNGSMVYSAPAATERISGDVISTLNASQVVYDPAGTNAVPTTVQAKLRETVSVKDFGAVGDGVTNDTTAIENWLTYCSDNKLVGFVPAGRYVYGGGILNQPWVCIRGAGAPKANATDSALIGGAIFQGTMRFSGTNIDIQDLGVDCGVDSGLGAVDVLIASTGGAYQGESCRLENVIGLGRAAGDAAHAILVEGYDNVSIDTVTGIRTYYGLAAKVKKASIRNVKGYQNAVAGCILRSNSPDGLCQDIIVDGVITVGEGVLGSGSGGSDYGFYLVADNQASRIILNNINAENASNTVAIRPNATINELIIDNVITRLSGQSALGFLTGPGTLYSCIVNNVVGVEMTAWLSRIESTVNQIQMQNLFGSGLPGFGYLNEMIRVESTVQATHFDNVQLVENYSLSTLGCIRYNNSYPNNTLGSNIRAKPQDNTAGGITTGIPQPGYQYSTSSGATVTLSPDYSPTGVTTIKSERSGVASTVTTVSNAYNPSQRFAIGARLIVINADVSTLTIKSTAVGTKSGSDIVMAASTAAMFVYGGAGWYEI